MSDKDKKSGGPTGSAGGATTSGNEATEESDGAVREASVSDYTEENEEEAEEPEGPAEPEVSPGQAGEPITAGIDPEISAEPNLSVDPTDTPAAGAVGLFEKAAEEVGDDGFLTLDEETQREVVRDYYDDEIGDNDLAEYAPEIPDRIDDQLDDRVPDDVKAAVGRTLNMLDDAGQLPDINEVVPIEESDAVDQTDVQGGLFSQESPMSFTSTGQLVVNQHAYEPDLANGNIQDVEGRLMDDRFHKPNQHNRQTPNGVNDRSPMLTDYSVEGAVKHEAAHAMHVDRLESTDGVSTEKFWNGDGQWSADDMTESEWKHVADEVSLRAANNPREFVAETAVAMMNKEPLSPDVLRLYEQYEGPEIEGYGLYG